MPRTWKTTHQTRREIRHRIRWTIREGCNERTAAAIEDKNAAICSRVKRGRRLRIDGQGPHREIGQSFVEAAPATTPPSVLLNTP